LRRHNVAGVIGLRPQWKRASNSVPQFWKKPTENANISKTPTKMTTRTSTDAGITEDVRQLKIQKVWNVVPSEFSMLTANPIRKIVDNIKKPQNTDKALIPLSLGTRKRQCEAGVFVPW
jgi:hypothetical protein